MKIAVVEKSRKGGLFLSPSNFGDKIEFIARQCGEFKEGEAVVALESVHDTKPEESHRGARFIRVRRLQDADITELVKLGWTTMKKVAAGTEKGALVVEDVTHLRIRCDSFRELNGPVLLRERREVRKDGLRLQVDCWIDDKNNSSIRLWEGEKTGSESWIEVPRKLAREILEKVFGYDVPAEAEKLRREREEQAVARAKAEAEAVAKWQVEEQRRIALFLSAHPEAREWFASPPSWKDITQAAVERKLARFLRSVKTFHYASFSKEFDCYDNIWEIQIGDEKFEFVAGGAIEYEHGED
ncbi:hypothetical protein KJ815_11725 [bacterium]|nr:hypothetical protein [bacterium]